MGGYTEEISKLLHFAVFTSRAAAGLIEVWVQEGTTFAFWRYSFALKLSFILILGCIDTFGDINHIKLQ